jgi:dTDP-4-dehydrorhamnose reductase
MVGGYVESVFDGYELFLTDVNELDICDSGSVTEWFKRIGPRIVLHLAAATDVDRCERDRGWARKVNVSGTENIVRGCTEAGAKLIFISSGAVFDGKKPEGYTEKDSTSPANYYGLTKFEAEKAIVSGMSDYLVIRAGWMMGGGSRDVKFVGKMAQLMNYGGPVKAVSDKYGSLTYAKDLLKGIKRLMNGVAPGIYHMVNHGMISRYDIALEMKNVLGLGNVDVMPVTSDCFPLPAPRGRSEALENSRLTGLGLDVMRPWKDALRDYLLNDYRACKAGYGQKT